jgi:hypothetical protein
MRVERQIRSLKSVVVLKARRDRYGASPQQSLESQLRWPLVLAQAQDFHFPVYRR